MTAPTSQAEKREFKAELKQLLHIITHSLYSNKEIFLRELISNASDAINKIKFDSLEHEEKLEGNKDWKIKITADRDQRTLTVSDNGIGMSREGIVDHLGTIASSGTRAFLENLRQQQQANRPDLIGQFGVGFYSAFMVADRVTVVSRMAGDPKDGVRWDSEGQGEFTIEGCEKPTRGTDVTLHLKEEDQEFLEPYRLRQIVKKFSNFIEHPVVMDVERFDEEKNRTVQEESLNDRKAIWLRQKSENTEEEYNEFYKQISGDFNDPARVIHYSAEGTQEFKVLLFIPAKRPFDMQWGEYKWGLRLYVQRVLIMDHCEEALPPYLRFVRGVVDSSDLPLNISREILQHNPLLERMQRHITRSILSALQEFKDDQYDQYVDFFKELGMILKEGVGRDHLNKDKIADLLLFQSMKTEPDQYISLSQYVEAMPAEQKEIYYLIGEDREILANSPYLERCRARGEDVLLLTDPVDEFMMPSLREFKEKKVKAIDRGELQPESQEGPSREVQEKFQPLLESLKSHLPEVGEVRLSTRLTESAACLVAGEGGMTAHMERLMQQFGQGNLPAGKRTLELNADHAVVQGMLRLYEKDAQDSRLPTYARILHDQALLAEGSRIKDPVGFARRINELLARDARE